MKNGRLAPRTMAITPGINPTVVIAVTTTRCARFKLDKTEAVDIEEAAIGYLQ